ncbi:MAG: hypothetical protein AB7O57_00830 [Hyphomicrobiaceae bacterium]
MTAVVVWLAIAALVVTFFWTLLALPPLPDAAAVIADSALAGWLSRNQLVVTGLAGFGGLSLAHVLNGWRDRAERRLAGVLAREARAMAESLETGGRALLQGRASPAAREQIADAVANTERVMLAATIAEIARLGAGATEVVARLRCAARRVTLAAPARDEQLAEAALEAAGCARVAHAVLSLHAAEGPAAADRLRPDCTTSATEAPRIETTPSARLLPAA